MLYRVHMSRMEKRTNLYLETAEVDIEAPNAEAAIDFVNTELQEGDMELYADWETKEVSSPQVEQTHTPSAKNATPAPPGAEAEFTVPEKPPLPTVPEGFRDAGDNPVGYPKDLDDIATDALQKEIERRNEAAKNGLCPYCNRALAEHTCKYAGRVADYHKVPPERDRDR